MIPAWPSSLWQQPARGRWSGGPRDERAVFSPEIGPPLSRRRTTGETRAFEATFPNFTGAMRATFETWVRDELQGGVKRFSWRDPVSGEPALWQIVASGELAYSFTALGADRHQLSLNLLRLPGTPWWAGYALAGDNRAPYAVADYANGIFGVDGTRSPSAAVAAGLARLPGRPARLLVGGGGRLNATLMRMLGERTGLSPEPVEAAGFDGDMLEAEAFAFLAARVARGLPLSAPSTTRVPRPLPGGRLSRP